MAEVTDYLIEQNGKDWMALLSDWLPLFPPKFTVWLVNRLGDIIAVFEDGSVHFFDVGAGTLTPIAADRGEFGALLDRDDKASTWLASSLVDACIGRGMTLSEDQCYGYRIPPFLGGEYVVENLEPTDLAVHYGLLASLWQQTKDLPEGTTVKISIVDQKR